MKELFGDIATNSYKYEIKRLKEEVENLQDAIDDQEVQIQEMSTWATEAENLISKLKSSVQNDESFWGRDSGQMTSKCTNFISDGATVQQLMEEVESF